MTEKLGPKERSIESNKIADKIAQYFVQSNKLKESMRKGQLIQVKDLARYASVSEQRLKGIINRGISVSYVEKGRQTNHVVFCDKNLCGLDTEEYVRTCLRRYLKSLEYDVIGEKDEELGFQKKEAIRDLVNLIGTAPNRPLKEILARYLVRNGIDLVAYEPKKAELLIVELKGVTKEKSDMHEAIIQMFQRYGRFKEVTTEEEFKRICFGSAFPYLAPNMSKLHYEDKFDILRTMYSTNRPELLYKFSASPTTRKERGMEILRPFVDGAHNINDLIRRGKVTFMLVEGTSSLLNLSSNSQVSL